MQELGNLAARLSGAASRDDVCRAGLEFAVSALDANAGAMLLVNDAGTALEACAVLGYDDASADAGRVLPLERRLAATDVVRTGTPVYAESRAEWNASYPDAALSGESAAALPLVAGSQVVGVLALEFDQPRGVTGTERLFVEAVAHECALALERSLLYERERAARREAEDASHAKDNFLAMVSHELRSPLNAILGWTQVLRSQSLDEQGVKGLDTIARNARMQARLLDEMLDVSRIVTGKLHLEMRAVLVTPLVQHVLDAARPSAEAKHVQLSARLDSNVGPVLGDPTRLQQIVWNLVSNAIKFTPRNGSVRVDVESGPTIVRLTVTDTGEGIAAELLPHLFDRLTQGAPGTKRMHGGLGLGLAIVRHLVDLHHGSVTAESLGPGRGATFTVKLPLVARRAHAEPVPPSGPPAQPDERPLSGIEVVLVEDADDSRELAAWLLAGAGAAVREARSAQEAFRLIEERRPHVLVADIGLPGEDGYSLMRRIRDREARRGGSRLPAAALTAFASADDRRAALLAGFNIHLPKPVDSDELTAVVLSLAGRT